MLMLLMSMLVLAKNSLRLNFFSMNLAVLSAKALIRTKLKFSSFLLELLLSASFTVRFVTLKKIFKNYFYTE